MKSSETRNYRARPEHDVKHDAHTGESGQMFVQVYGARVRQARTIRRLTSAAILTEMGWKGARQTRLEQSESSTIPRHELDRLASILSFPASYFTSAPASHVPVGRLLFRAPKSTTLAEKEHLASFAAFVGDLLDVLDSRQRLPRVRLPRNASAQYVSQAAASAREQLGLAPNAPITYLTHDLERAGVPVVVRPRRTRGAEADLLGATHEPTEKHLGYSCWTGAFNDRPLIVLRSQLSWERTRWTLAHELGHLVLHGDSTEASEDEANRFAAEFLAPRQALASSLPRELTLHALVDVKLSWGISIGALIRHLHDSDLISGQRFETLQKQLYSRKNPSTGSTWGRVEPGFDHREPELPRLLSRWAERGLGATDPKLLAVILQLWPIDLVEDAMLLQRQAPGTRATAVRPAVEMTSRVVSLSDRRRDDSESTRAPVARR